MEGPGATPLRHPLTADEIERAILDLAARLRCAPPVRGQGTNASYWRFSFDGRMTDFHVVAQDRNTAMPPTGRVEWLLRIQEPDPPLFARTVEERFFSPGSGLARAMSGGVRTQFKSTDLR